MKRSRWDRPAVVLLIAVTAVIAISADDTTTRVMTTTSLIGWSMWLGRLSRDQHEAGAKRAAWRSKGS